MLTEYISNFATRMGMSTPKVSLVDGQSLGCIDTHLVNISTKGSIVSALIFRKDLENLANGVGCVRLEARIRRALSSLQILLEAAEQKHIISVESKKLKQTI